MQAASSAAIVKAADTGKTAWKPGSTLSDTQKVRDRVGMLAMAPGLLVITCKTLYEGSSVSLAASKLQNPLGVLLARPCPPFICCSEFTFLPQRPGRAAAHAMQMAQKLAVLPGPEPLAGQCVSHPGRELRVGMLNKLSPGCGPAAELRPGALLASGTQEVTTGLQRHPVRCVVPACVDVPAACAGCEERQGHPEHAARGHEGLTGLQRRPVIPGMPPGVRVPACTCRQ